MSGLKSKFGKNVLIAGLIAGSSLLASTSFALPSSGVDKGDYVAKNGHQVQNQGESSYARHVTQLKAELKLQPNQEAAWNAFANTTQPGKHSVNKVDRQAKHEAFKNMNTPQRLDKMVARSGQRHKHLVHRSETVKQFYAQLNPEQQKVFDAKGHRFGHGKHHHHHRDQHKHS